MSPKKNITENILLVSSTNAPTCMVTLRIMVRWLTGIAPSWYLKYFRLLASPFIPCIVLTWACPRPFDWSNTSGAYEGGAGSHPQHGKHLRYALHCVTSLGRFLMPNQASLGGLLAQFWPVPCWETVPLGAFVEANQMCRLSLALMDRASFS